MLPVSLFDQTDQVKIHSLPKYIIRFISSAWLIPKESTLNGAYYVETNLLWRPLILLL
jgi:hypothetical protein